MQIKTHQSGNSTTAELISEDILISNAEDGLQLLADLYYQSFDKIIIHEKNITPLFFDLKNGLAGEILQKFSNYRVQLAIIGKFDKYTSKSIRDFIYESNKGRQVSFLESAEKAIACFSE